jgi:hypothetical protein
MRDYTNKLKVLVEFIFPNQLILVAVSTELPKPTAHEINKLH